MKKCLIIIFIGLLSCTSMPKKYERVESYFILDFSKYNDLGFLFTPGDYNGEYKAIGNISYKYIPAAELIKKPEIDNTNYKYVKCRIDTSSKIVIEKLNFEEIMDTIYKNVKAKGADAILYLKIEPESEAYSFKNLTDVTVEGINISGFAIKREGPVR